MDSDLRDALETLLAEPIQGFARVSGGDINEAARLDTAAGRYFVKFNRHPPPGMFELEAAGLRLLAESGAVRVPDVVGSGVVDTSGEAFLVLEWIEPGRPGPSTARGLGRSLAALHERAADRFGLDDDNYIGSLPQPNCWETSWREFFATHRIGAQLRFGRESGRLPAANVRRAEQLLQRLERWIPERPTPSLLHGDLWGGNYMTEQGGGPVLIDPAVYHGHREIELAFTELFGGFAPDFYAAYREVWPLAPEYPARRDLYNLYPILVHANLFGGHYISRADRIVRQYL